MHGRKPKLSAEKVAQLHRWKAIGTTRKEAARTFGVSLGTLDRYLRLEHKNHYRSESSTGGVAR